MQGRINLKKEHGEYYSGPNGLIILFYAWWDCVGAGLEGAGVSVDRAQSLFQYLVFYRSVECVGYEALDRQGAADIWGGAGGWAAVPFYGGRPE